MAIWREDDWGFGLHLNDWSMQNFRAVFQFRQSKLNSMSKCKILDLRTQCFMTKFRTINHDNVGTF